MKVKAQVYSSFFMLLLSVLTILEVKAQEGLQFISDDIQDGYMLFQRNQDAFLVDRCGQRVHRWPNVNSQFHPKLLENGNLVFIQLLTNRVIELDWDGNVIATTILNTANDIRLDYEVIVLESGNYLCAAREIWSQQQFLDLGFNWGVAALPDQTDMILELERGTGDILWQWNIADHVIQERDSNLPNYGSIIDNPQLVNMDALSTFDWFQEESFMINGFDYNPSLDQIAISVRKMGEVMIIDHSTTTEEARGHSGGAQGKGGDILYRWGNPQNYNQGTEDDHKFFLQHNPNWIEHGEYKDDLIVFDNGLNRPGTNFLDQYSSVIIIDTEVSSSGAYAQMTSGRYPPNEPTKEYNKFTTNNEFFSGYTSSAEVLPNGNIYITVGGDARGMEITEEGELVWGYGMSGLTNFLFRSEKYSTDYPAFDGKELIPGDVLEVPPSEVVCLSSNQEQAVALNLKAFVTDQRKVKIEAENFESYTYELYNTAGQMMDRNKAQGDRLIDYHHLPSGVYLMKIRGKNGSSYAHKLFLK